MHEFSKLQELKFYITVCSLNELMYMPTHAYMILWQCKSLIFPKTVTFALSVPERKESACTLGRGKITKFI